MPRSGSGIRGRLRELVSHMMRMISDDDDDMARWA